MTLIRSALLSASESSWLRERATKYRFVRKAVKRFVSGEELEDALVAARPLRASGIKTMLTHLGENLTTLDEAEQVTEHYLAALDRVEREALDAQLSVKLTQLGLEQSSDRAAENAIRLARRASSLGNFVWIDMEGSQYTDVTLEVFRRVRAEQPNIGVCLQACLRRTEQDLESLLPLGAAIRLVKGAYDEPPSIAFRRKREVDEQFVTLAQRILSVGASHAPALLGIATHDPRLIRRLEEFVAQHETPKEWFEFEMLYGIRPGEQLRLANAGYSVRVLISYGEYWFPWYMRRLAERPANVLFAAKSLFSS